jgi:probable rRNA maturation factor
MASDDPDPSPRIPRPAPTRARRLVVSVCDGRGAPLKERSLASWLARVAPGTIRGSVTLALVSDARMRTLNRTWRGIDRVTDVLSFPMAAAPAAKRASNGARVSRITNRGHLGDREHLGDVVIAKGRAARQARDAGHALQTELRVLALHGLLHLAGFDHERDAGEMRRVEERLRRRGGLREGLIERAV